MHLFNCLLTQISSQPITWQQLETWSRRSEVQTKHQNGEERLSDFECGTVVGVFQKLLIYWDLLFMYNHLQGLQRMVQKEKISSKQQLCGCKCLVDARSQRRMARLVQADRKTTEADRKTTVTQITSCYNRNMQKSISECTTHWTLNQMG